MVNFLHEILLPACLVVGPVIGYIPQYMEIRKTSNPAIFSPLVILILLVSNILRIWFWLVKRFELALLLQSVVMIAAQLIMLELMVRLRSRQIDYMSESFTLFGRSLGDFWNWNKLGKYIQWISVFTLVIGALTFLDLIFLRSQVYTEVLGAFALLIESTLAIPQLMQNYHRKSTRGLRVELVGAWALGDAAKTILFVARKSPIQFIICGIIQLIVDFGIFYQMRIYRDGQPLVRRDGDFDVVASATLQATTPLGKDLLRLPPKSCTKSLDNFDEENEELPRRSSSLRSYSAAPFYRTL